MVASFTVALQTGYCAVLRYRPIHRLHSSFFWFRVFMQVNITQVARALSLLFKWWLLLSLHSYLMFCQPFMAAGAPLLNHQNLPWCCWFIRPTSWRLQAFQRRYEVRILESYSWPLSHSTLCRHFLALRIVEATCWLHESNTPYGNTIFTRLTNKW